ncbi:Coronin-like protein crn1 [Coemansia sp. RSA 2671]|nr:Coronin-like protein crn1 [Coemansia sp. RSA 2675]KAJ2348840.1 Coronin-like protein crn1 [Coemansia sp. RSA 2671]
MASIVRASKYRHVFGTASKREECYENLRVSINAWDTNYVCANPKYMAVNWNAGGGGAFCVVPHLQAGKLRGDFPLFSAHSGAVLDTAFSPFDDDIIASGAEDHQAMVWRVPADLAEREEEDVTQPLVVLGGHGRKVGHVAWNPVAENVLAVASSDHTVKIWDVGQVAVKSTLTGFGDSIMSIAWNHDGTLLAATCRDKRLRVFDARSGNIVQEGAGHLGVKGSRVVWLGSEPRLVTTGFSRTSDREIYLWDSMNLAAPISKLNVDMSAGMLMPFYDSGSSMLYVAGKGDGNIRYYEYTDDKLYLLSEYSSSEPQRGLGVMPKRGVDVSKCEVMRFFKVASNSLVEPVSFRVPRKAETFQSDIYPPAHAGRPALSADQYFAGQDAAPVVVDMEALFRDGPLIVAGEAPAPAPAMFIRCGTKPPPAEVSQNPPSPPVSTLTPERRLSPAPSPQVAPSVETRTPPSPPPTTASITPVASNEEANRLRDENARLQAQLGQMQAQAGDAQQRAQRAEQAAADSEQSLRTLRAQLDDAVQKAAKDADALRAQVNAATTSADEFKARLAKAEDTAREHELNCQGLEKELRDAIDAANSLALAAEKAADSLQAAQ